MRRLYKGIEIWTSDRRNGYITSNIRVIGALIKVDIINTESHEEALNVAREYIDSKGFKFKWMRIYCEDKDYDLDNPNTFKLCSDAYYRIYLRGYDESKIIKEDT